MLSHFVKTYLCSVFLCLSGIAFSSTGPDAGLHADLSDSCAQIKEKLKQGEIDANKLDSDGLTFLQKAICAGRADVVNLLCGHDATDVNAYSKKGLTALHYAIERKQCTGDDPLQCNACKIIGRLLDYPTLQVAQPKRFCARILTYLPYIPFFRSPMLKG